MVFGGFMGGEYIKGIAYDDYITPALFREFEFGPNRGNFKKNIHDILRKRYINTNYIDEQIIGDILQDSPYFLPNRIKWRELNRLYYLTGSMHYYQDIASFSSVVPYVINPFMDIDFLTELFNSSFSFLKNNNNNIHEILRINKSAFHLGITNILEPKLSSINYAKEVFILPMNI